MGGGYAIDNSVGSAITESDYNDFLTTGNFLAKINVNDLKTKVEFRNTFYLFHKQ